MVNVDLDKQLYEEVKQLVKKHKLEFPSVKFFVQRAVVKEVKSSEHYEIEDFYSKVKEILSNDSKLKEKVEKIFEKRVKEL